MKHFANMNQLEPIAELDGAGNSVATFLYAERAHVPSLMLKGGNSYRIVADHLGSVRLVVDIATGSIAQRMDYDAFGNVIEDTNPGFQPFGYAGGLYDRDTGLVHFGARDYDPEIGRWTAKDRLLFVGGRTNPFAYSLADPINRIDSNGLLESDVRNAVTIVKEKIPEVYRPEYTVEFADLSAFGSGSGAFGRTDRNTKQILISNEFEGQLEEHQRDRLLETVIHEYLHASDSYWHNIRKTIEDELGIGNAHTEIHVSAKALADMYGPLPVESNEGCDP